MKILNSKFDVIDSTEKVLLKNGTIIDPSQKFERQSDILIIDGKIAEIGKIDTSGLNAKVYDISGKIVSPGWIDMHVHLREPGREDKETIDTGCMSASRGGFTAVCCMPNTEPAIDNQEVVEFVKKRAKDLPVEVFPIGAVTKKRKGEELAEMYEMFSAGAVAFSDDGAPVFNSEIMRRALEYVKMFDIPIIDHAEEPKLSGKGVMNEGYVSTSLGLPGVPSISEEIAVMRNIMLAEFTDSRIHITHLSTKKSVELIRQAKEKGLKVTCDVTPHHFSLTDEAVRNFNTNTKMNPPLRTSLDVSAIKQGLKDGTIDCIATDHAPHTIEEKEMEYNYAPFGIIGLETAMGIIITELLNKKVLTLSEIIIKLTINPRRILRLPEISIKKGESANLAIFDTNTEWVVDSEKFLSKSKNSPFIGWKFNGRAFGIINKGMVVINS